MSASFELSCADDLAVTVEELHRVDRVVLLDGRTGTTCRLVLSSAQEATLALALLVRLVKRGADAELHRLHDAVGTSLADAFDRREAALERQFAVEEVGS